MMQAELGGLKGSPELSKSARPVILAPVQSRPSLLEILHAGDSLALPLQVVLFQVRTAEDSGSISNGQIRFTSKLSCLQPTGDPIYLGSGFAMPVLINVTGATDLISSTATW